MNLDRIGIDICSVCLVGHTMTTNNTPENRLRCGNIQTDDLAECQREGAVFSTTFSRPFKDQAGIWRNGTSFELNDTKVLITVGHEAKVTLLSK